MKIVLFAFLSLISVSLSAQVPNYVPTNGLVGWWPFNGNANDESGNGNNGLASGGPTLTNGHLGNASSAYYFDGVDDLITVPHNNSLNFPNNEISISVWISIPDLPDNNLGQNFISKQENQGSNQNGFHLVLSDVSDSLVFRYKGGSTQPQTAIHEEFSALPIANYFHLVAIVDVTDNQNKLYINGQLIANSSSVNDIGGMNVSDMVFGHISWTNQGNSEYFQGQLDDIAIFNRPLTECEINELYSSQVLNSATNDVHAACNSYTWIDGNTYTSSNNTATHTLTNAAGCDSVVTLDLTINTVDNTITDNSPTLTANAVGATYQWLDCNDGYSIINGETEQSFTTSNNGNYAVIVTENNCTDTSQCLTVSNVGLPKSQYGEKISVFPNPTSGFINIDLGVYTESVSVVITNSLGQEVLRMNKVNTQEISFDFNSEPGTYHLKVIKGINEPRTFLIIKQ